MIIVAVRELNVLVDSSTFLSRGSIVNVSFNHKLFQILPLHTGNICLTRVQLHLSVVSLSGYLDSALGPHPGIGMIVYDEK